MPLPKPAAPHGASGQKKPPLAKKIRPAGLKHPTEHRLVQPAARGIVRRRKTP